MNRTIRAFALTAVVALGAASCPATCAFPAARGVLQLVAHDVGRELVARPVDDELPAVSRAQVLEDAVELVLPGDAGHPQRHDDAPWRRSG